MKQAIEALLLSRSGVQTNALTKQIVPYEYFEERANEAGVAIAIHTIITPTVKGMIKIPGLQFVKSIGDKPEDIFEFLRNEELVVAHTEHFAAECKKFYGQVYHVMTGGFNRDER